MEDVYHVCTRSIAGYKVFASDFDYCRIVEAIRYYRQPKPVLSLSAYLRMKQEGRAVEFVMPRKDSIVDVIAYCIMPNHIHLLLNQTQESGLSVFMSNMLNSYTRYFNVKHDRKGPLWESRPKKTLIDSDEQLLHVTRYIHLNPVTAYMADRPQDWVPSSYSEYVSCIKDQDRICKFRGLISMDRQAYRAFVEEGVKYQREMARCRNNLAGGTSQVVCGGVK